MKEYETFFYRKFRSKDTDRGLAKFLQCVLERGKIMKTTITVLTVIFFFVTASAGFARGYSSGNHGGNNRGYHDGGHQKHGYHKKPHFRGYRYGGHHKRPHHRRYSRQNYYYDGLGLAVGVMGGLMLGSALMSPPPPPKFCYEDRIVNGEWQVSNYTGYQVWVSFPYPVTKRFQVPCY
jgi:hypothetical protein